MLDEEKRQRQEPRRGGCLYLNRGWKRSEAWSRVAERQSLQHDSPADGAAQPSLPVNEARVGGLQSHFCFVRCVRCRCFGTTSFSEPSCFSVKQHNVGRRSMP